MNIFRKEKQKSPNLCNVVPSEDCRGPGWAFYLILSSYKFNHGHVSPLRLNMFMDFLDLSFFLIHLLSHK